MLSGIPASNYSHVSYFPSRDNYDEFYGFIIRVVNIAFEKFAACVQALLVQHLRSFGDKPAEWYEEWWTGARGRYCLCHCMHGGTNNNMGVEVDWRDIKKLCPPSSKLSSFLGALVHFIKQLGKEHQQHLIGCGHPNAFICDPILSKDFWDQLQDLHPKTLSSIFLLRATSKTEAKGGAALAKKFAERVQEIEATEGSALHIKIEKWHEDNEIKEIEVGFPQMEDIRTLLIPRQHVLKRIDPCNSKPIEDVRRELRSLKNEYVNIVVNGNHSAEMGVSEALDLYETFHHLERKDSWGAVPWSCSCVNSHKHCVCKHGGLITSVFNPAVKVPKDYVAAEPGLRKKTRALKGAAGPRRARLLAEIKATKTKSASKIPFMSMQSSHGVAAEGKLALPAPAQDVPPGEQIVIPEVVLPSSDDDEVLVSSLCTGSSPDSGDRHPPTHRDVLAVCAGPCSRAGRPRLNRRRLNHVPREKPSSKILYLPAACRSLPRLPLAIRR